MNFLGYPGGYGYYGRPGLLGTVGNVLDGLLGFREKPAGSDVNAAAPSAEIVPIESAAVPAAESGSPVDETVVFQ